MRPFIVLAALAAVLAGCRSAPERPVSGPPPGGIPVRGMLADGRLDLADGSRWVVQPAGQSATLHWRAGDPVAVVRSGHPAWPFLLTHLAGGSRALARPDAARSLPPHR